MENLFFLNRVLILYFFVGAFFNGVSFAACNHKTELNEIEPLCQVINAIELGSGCSSFKYNQEIYDACLSLEDLSKGGNCGNLKGKESVTTYLVCNEIYLGLSANSCANQISDFSMLSPQETEGVDAIVPSSVLSAMCEFGLFIKKNHPSIADSRNAAILSHTMETGLDSAFPDSPRPKPMIETKIEDLSQILTQLSVSPRSTLAPLVVRNRAKNLGIKVLFKLQQSKKVPITTYELAIFLKQLIKIVDKNRKHWAEEAEKVGNDITIEIGDEVSGDVAPCSIQVSATDKVNIHLGSVLINNTIKAIGAIGVGALKKISLSFDYDLASLDSQKDGTDLSFSASARLLKSPVSGRDESLEREARIQKRFDGLVGVAPAGAIVSLSNQKNHSTKSLVASQKYFPFDLLKFARHLASDEFETVEGLSKEQIRIDLAVELLEGLHALHQAGVHHRDIKPANILINYDSKRLPHAYIADFGEAYDLVNLDENKGVRSFAGTIQYMAPEYVKGSGSPLANKNLKNDVWGMGLVLYDLEHGQEVDFFGKGERLVLALAYKLVNKLIDYQSLGEIYGIHFDPKHPPSHFTYEYVMFRMLNPDVNQRASSEEALKLMKEVQLHRLQLPPLPIKFKIALSTSPGKSYAWSKIVPTPVSPEFTGIQKIEHQIESRYKNETDKYLRVYEEEKKTVINLSLGSSATTNSSILSDSSSSSIRSKSSEKLSH
jgi:serine/threonine protein kinase